MFHRPPKKYSEYLVNVEQSIDWMLKMLWRVKKGEGIVTKINAGSNITIDPVTGTGEVTINATGGGGSYVPYVGATTDVNLGTHQLLAARGTFANNGSSDTLTVNHTSGSGYGIIVTKGGANEALYVNKTSGSGNAMTVVGGRTSLVDLALSSVSNAVGDFLTLNGGVVHRRTAAQVLSDISVPTPTLAQVTTAGNTTTNAITVGGLTVNTDLIYTDLVNNAVIIGGTSLTNAFNKFEVKDLGTTGVLGRLQFRNDNNAYTYLTVTSNNVGFNLGAHSNGAGYISVNQGLNLTSNHINNNATLWLGNGSRLSLSNSAATSRYLTVSTAGNVIIGGSTDAGYMLDVVGTTRLQGLSSINGVGVINTALAVYGNGNGAGNFLFRMYDASAVERFYLTASGNFRLNGSTDIGTTGTDEKWRMVLNFAPTSGTRQHSGIYLTQTINQTGGANGVTRGIYVEPTITSAVDFRAIETTVGNVILGSISGNVGIGTVSPTYKLEVSSSAYVGLGVMSGANNNAEINFQNTGYSVPRWTIRATGAANGSSGTLTFQRLSNTFPLTITSGDNILIGTTVDAGYKLDVNGDIRGQRLYSNTIRDTNLNNVVQTTIISASTTDTTIGSGTTSTLNLTTKSSTGIVYIPNGNVGIGVITPTAKLQVAGSITAATAIARGVYFNNTLVAAANNDVLVGLDINPTFTNGAFTGVSNYAARIQGTVVINAAAFNVTNSLYVGGNGGSRLNNIVIGGGYGSATITDSGGINTLRLSSTGFGFYGNYNTLLASAWLHVRNVVSGSPIFRLDDASGVQSFTVLNSGNVLVGTTTDAGQKLQVIGNARFSSATDTYHYITSTATGSAGTIYTNTYHSFFTGTNYATADSWEVYDLTSSASRIHISGPTGNVAINKTYAVYKLDVEGDIRSTTSAYLATTSGLVGIGTTSPTSKLHVVGNINVSGVFAVGGVGGWTGTINIPLNPVGQQNIQVAGGIIVNVS